MSKPVAGSAPLRWATVPLIPADVTAPDTTHMDEGWQDAEEPAHSYFNYWMNLVYLWLVYLDGLTGEALTWTALETFSKGVSITNDAMSVPATVTGDAGAGSTMASVKAHITGIGNSWGSHLDPTQGAWAVSGIADSAIQNGGGVLGFADGTAGSGLAYGGYFQGLNGAVGLFATNSQTFNTTWQDQYAAWFRGSFPAASGGTAVDLSDSISTVFSQVFTINDPTKYFGAVLGFGNIGNTYGVGGRGRDVSSGSTVPGMGGYFVGGNITTALNLTAGLGLVARGGQATAGGSTAHGGTAAHFYGGGAPTGASNAAGIALELDAGQGGLGNLYGLAIRANHGSVHIDDGALQVSSTGTFGSDLITSGNLSVAGNQTLVGTLGVTAAATFNALVTALASITVTGNVTASANVQGASLTATGTASSIPLPAKINATYLGTWVVSTGAQLVYWKDAFGMVHLQGSASGGTLGTAIMQLPVGYRPSATVSFPQTNSGAALIYVQIDTSGNLTTNNNTGNQFFDGISFRP